MKITLDNKKVLRQFGPYPQRGKVMKMFTTKTQSAGMRSKSLIIMDKDRVVGKKYVQNPLDRGGEKISYKWVANEIHVWPVVALIPVGKNQWEVQVKPEYLEQTMQWLRYNCG